MSEPVLTATELLAWTENTAENWRQLLGEHPELLAVDCDIAGVSTVGQLLQHIVAVQLRYAERLADLPVSDYANIPVDSIEAIYAVHQQSIAIFHRLLESEMDWDGPIEFVTRRMGPARSARKTVLFHALLHGIRHYAQLATLVRQHGVKPHWAMDYLFMNVRPA